MRDNRLTIVSSDPITAEPDQPVQAAQVVSSFLGADRLGPDNLTSCKSTSSSFSRLFPFAHTKLQLSLPYIKEACRRLEEGRPLLFVDTRSAVDVLRAIGIRVEKTPPQTVILAPMDGSLAGLKPLGRFPMYQQVGKIVTFSPHQHLYAVERLQFPVGKVEMIPPSVDIAFFSENSETRDADRVVIVGDHPVQLGGSLGKKAHWIRKNQELQTVRDEFRRAGVVVLLAKNKYDTRYLNQFLWAAASGAPLVVPRTFTLQHLLEDSRDGFFYEPGNFEQAVTQAKQIIGNTELAVRIGLNLKSRIAKVCSHQHLAARVNTIYRNIENHNTATFYLLVNQTAVLQ